MSGRMRLAMRAAVIAAPVMLAGCADYQQGWSGAGYQAAPPAVAYGGGAEYGYGYAPTAGYGYVPSGGYVVGGYAPAPAWGDGGWYRDPEWRRAHPDWDRWNQGGQRDWQNDAANRQRALQWQQQQRENQAVVQQRALQWDQQQKLQQQQNQAVLQQRSQQWEQQQRQNQAVRYSSALSNGSSSRSSSRRRLSGTSWRKSGSASTRSNSRGDQPRSAGLPAGVRRLCSRSSLGGARSCRSPGSVTRPIGLSSDSSVVLIDPFFTGNPAFVGDPEAASAGATHIVLTHGHSDHVGDSVAISRQTGATVITNFELCMWLARQGAGTNANR